MPKRRTPTPFLFSALALSSLLFSCKENPQPTTTTAPTTSPTTTPSNVVVSPQTTRITSPLRPDGSVDYFAYLNHKYSANIPAENNAANILVALLSLHHQHANPNEQQLLTENAARITPLLNPVTIPRTERFLTINQAKTQFNSDLAAQLLNEWSTIPSVREAGPNLELLYPAITAWLDANKAALRHVEIASSRPRCQFPVVPPQHPLYLAYNNPWNSALREATWALVLRAQLNLGRFNVGAFIIDLQTLQRLAKLQADSPFLLSGLYGVHTANLPLQCIDHLLKTGQYDSHLLEQIKPLLKDPTIPLNPAWFEESECFALLSLMQFGPSGQFLNQLKPTASWAKPPTHNPAVYTDLLAMRWDIAMIAANSAMDDYAPLFRATTHAQFLEAQNKITARRESLPPIDLVSIPTGLNLRNILLTEEEAHSAMQAGLAYLKRQPNESVGAYSARMGRWMASIHDHLALVILQFRTSEMLAATTRVALALAQYHLAHNKFPDTLADLTPTYLDSIPLDYFTNAPLVYRRDGNDALIYSLGPDLKDNQANPLRLPSPGDIGVRIAPPRKK